jgi:DNA repair protein RecO (recombination protein O)
MSTFHARGIVLRREHWRDAARLYTIYTREAGKLLAVGRGTRRVLSKLGAHLEPYTLVDLHLARGRRTETVCGAIMLRAPDPLASDDERYLAACFTAEAIDHFVKTGERDEEFWSLIESWYADLSVLPEAKIGGRLAVFVWRFMSHLGYHPKLDACLECDRGLSYEAVRFLPARGAAACHTCLLDERSLVGAVPLASAERDEIAECLAGNTAPLASTASRIAALALLETHLDRPLSSLPLVQARLAAAHVPMPSRA